MLKDNRYIPVVIKYKVEIQKDGKVKMYCDVSKSFVRAFGVWLARMFGVNLSCFGIDGNSYTLRNSDYCSNCTNYYWSPIQIVFSSNPNDQNLSWTNYKLASLLGNVTRALGYPQVSYVEDAMSGQIIITDKYTYTGANTLIYAMALYGNWDVASGSFSPSYKTFMLIKDVFDPPLNLETDSVITASYQIKVQV